MTKTIKKPDFGASLLKDLASGDVVIIEEIEFTQVMSVRSQLNAWKKSREGFDYKTEHDIQKRTLSIFVL